MTLMTQHTNTLFTKIIDKNRKIGTDLKGKFPLTSSRGNKYLFILYKWDNNIILIRPMKAISDSNFVRVLKDLHEHLLTRGLNPLYIILYNEASPAFQRELNSKYINFQLSPRGIHRRNASELAISTFRDHLIPVL